MEMGKVAELAKAAGYKGDSAEADYLVALLSSVETYEDAKERSGLSMSGLKKAMHRNGIKANPVKYLEVSIAKH